MLISTTQVQTMGPFLTVQGKFEMLETNSDSDSQVPRGEAPLCFVPSPTGHPVVYYLVDKRVFKFDATS